MKFCLFITFIVSLLLYSCSSGEYDIDELEVERVEKTVIYDTAYVPTDEGNITTPPSGNEQYTYTIQIGAFVIPENFQRFYEQARINLGSDVYFNQISNLYKIRVGSFSYAPDAILYLDRVRNMGYSDAFIVTSKISR